jgi:hypothetical protein
MNDSEINRYRTFKIGLTVTLWLTIMLFDPLDTPYVNILLLTLFLVILTLHFKERKLFYKKLKQYEFEFKVRKYQTWSIQAIKFILIYVMIVSPLLASIPYDFVFEYDYPFVYVLFVSILLVILRLFDSNYSFYYFGKDLIIKPGKQFKIIKWPEILNVFDFADKNIVRIILNNGETIDIGRDYYHTQGKKPEEFIEYIKNRI